MWPRPHEGPETPHLSGAGGPRLTDTGMGRGWRAVWGDPSVPSLLQLPCRGRAAQHRVQGVPMPEHASASGIQCSSCFLEASRASGQQEQGRWLGGQTPWGEAWRCPRADPAGHSGRPTSPPRPFSRPRGTLASEVLQAVLSKPDVLGAVPAGPSDHGAGAPCTSGPGSTGLTAAAPRSGEVGTGPACPAPSRARASAPPCTRAAAPRQPSPGPASF